LLLAIYQLNSLESWIRYRHAVSEADPSLTPLCLYESLHARLHSSKDDPNVIDLVDTNGVVHYRKQRITVAPLYTIEIAQSNEQKKILELCNPSSTVELKYTGTLSFRWGFKWEEHDFEWKREECYMIRKPDPPVLVAITKEPAGDSRPVLSKSSYNLNRFEIEDRKGLEIVLLTALLTFQDANDVHHSTLKDERSTPILAAHKSSQDIQAPPPAPPPRPPAKTGVDRIAELQGSEASSTRFADEVPKVLQAVEETKRIRHKAGLPDDLHQRAPHKSRQRRKVRDAKEPRRSPEQNPDARAAAYFSDTCPPPQTKEDKKKGKGKKLVRNGDSSHSKIHSHQVHPNQPSPSPSQLGNPSIYVAPPPPKTKGRKSSPTPEVPPRPVSVVAGIFDKLRK
ncbi:hypothetical protein CPB85DRAFT_1263337, partial [Mucidula mucida]